MFVLQTQTTPPPSPPSSSSSSSPSAKFISLRYNSHAGFRNTFKNLFNSLVSMRRNKTSFSFPFDLSILELVPHLKWISGTAGGLLHLNGPKYSDRISKGRGEEGKKNERVWVMNDPMGGNGSLRVEAPLLWSIVIGTNRC